MKFGESKCFAEHDNKGRSKNGSGTPIKDGIIPPTKVVHRIATMPILSVSVHATLPYGSNATLYTAVNFLPGCPVVM